MLQQHQFITVGSEFHIMSPRRRAEIIHTKRSSAGKARMKAFVLDGLAWSVFKAQELYTEIGYLSFDEYLEDPESSVDGGTTYGHLTVQAVDLFHRFFRIKASKMFGIGFRKFMLIAPQGQQIHDVVQASMLDAAMARQIAQTAERNAVDLIASGEPAITVQQTVNRLRHTADGLEHIARQRYDVGRAQALMWLEKAQRMTAKDLKAEIGEDGGNGGWETLCDQVATVAELKSMTATELIAYFGLTDKPDDYQTVINIKGRDSQ